MAIKHIMAMGIGFADVGDNLKYLPTLGFTVGEGGRRGKMTRPIEITWTDVIASFLPPILYTQEILR